jgi:hypothetical protein
MIYYCPIAEYLRPGLTALAQIIMNFLLKLFGA